MDPPQTQPRHHSWELTGRAPITSYSRAWVQVAGRCPGRPGMLHAQSTGRTPAHPAPVRYARCACWDVPLCTLTTHGPVLTPFSQSTSSPPPLYAVTCKRACTYMWSLDSCVLTLCTPNPPKSQGTRIPGASCTISHHQLTGPPRGTLTFLHSHDQGTHN